MCVNVQLEGLVQNCCNMLYKIIEIYIIYEKIGLQLQCTVPQIFNLLPFLYFYFVCEIRFITNRKYALFVFTWSACHLTIITLIYYIKIVYVLL